MTDTMTTAEATVATLAAHGIDTLYALPGVHNDHLFDALYKASDRIKVVHPRHEQGDRLYGARRGARDRPPPGLCGGARPRPPQHRRGAAHRLCHERAGARADRADSRCRHRPRHRAFARDPRPGRDHQPAGRLLRAHRGPDAASALVAKALAAMGTTPARPRRARMRDRRVGPQRAGAARRPVRAAGTGDRRGCDRGGGGGARRGEAAVHHLRRRRPGRVRRSDRARPHAAGAGARLSARPRRARQPRSPERDLAARPRPLGGSRCRARRRHADVLPVHPVGHGRRRQDHPHRFRSRGAGAGA